MIHIDNEKIEFDGDFGQLMSEVSAVIKGAYDMLVESDIPATTKEEREEFTRSALLCAFNMAFMSEDELLEACKQLNNGKIPTLT